ncbi:hypothetical protein SLS53_001958 [Cytospora paraplurivora]|uniref:Uncharacterized protein n=2 Tax=Cytospora TaxID=117544 RepID=A0A423X4U8_9PEZI|nr:hypothetical protein VPNG_05118 [Cytospora leucostoma]
MSASGGFYTYRCKYFYTHNCTNWVYTNNAPCPSCLAQGRDTAEAPAPSQAWNIGVRDIMVPSWQDGVFQQRIMEYVVTDPSSFQWNLRYKANQPPTGVAHGSILTASGMPQRKQAQA